MAYAHIIRQLPKPQLLAPGGAGEVHLSYMFLPSARVALCLTGLTLAIVACRREEASGPRPVWHNLYPPNGAQGNMQGAPNGGPYNPGANYNPGPGPAAGAPGYNPGPAPGPAPGAAPAPAPAHAAPWAVANLDPNDDFRVGTPEAIPDCMARLTALGVRARPAEQPVHDEGGRTCGTPQAVFYDGSGAGIKWSTPPKVTCLVALALSRLETVLQEEAQRHLGARVKRIDHMGTYSCRPMVRFNMASEHSFANALDFAGVELEGGKRITIDANWGPPAEKPTAPEGKFLRAVGRRLYDENVFSVVLTPAWDALHKNHLHLDQARYRVDANEPRGR